MEIIASILLLLGSLLAVLAAVGLQRFRDVFARMHAATKPATLGLAMTLLGTAFVIPSPGGVAKLLAVIIFQFLTAPVGAHLVGRATFRAGTELHPSTIFDDLATQLRRRS